jgi:signal transduction histidine kinase
MLLRVTERLAALRVRRPHLPLLLPIAAFVVLAGAGAITVEEHTARTQAMHELRDRSAAVASGAIAELADKRRTYETYARLLADTPGLTRAVAGARGGVATGLLAKLKQHEAFEEVTVYQADGTELLHLGPPKGDRVDAGRFASAMAGRTSSMGIVAPAGLVVIASTPIEAGHGIVGVLVVATTLRGPQLAVLRRQDGAQLALYQGNSLVTSSTERSDLQRVLTSATTSHEGVERLNRLLSPFHLYAAERPLEGGAMLAFASSTDLDAFARERTHVVLGAAVALLVALALIGTFLSRTVTRPLKGMAAVTSGMLAGDYTGRVAASTIPELDALSTAVNHLADQAEGRVLVEEQLRQSQKMEAVGRLAGGIAHDFNNLLTAIIGRSELLQLRLAADDPARVDIEEILGASNRAASLTRQLLAFSRKQVLEPKVLSLNHIVAESEKLLCRLIGEDVELACELEPELGRVRADAGQIEQTILNLAVNARDAMPQGGRLTIATSNVRRDGTDGLPPGDYVALRVTDTGVGMDPETQSNIFEPFFTTKEPGKGTGLGLSTVHGVVEQSGGSIRVQSEPGRGAVFTIYLPRLDEPVEPPSVGAPAGRAVRGTETILLVEDEAIVRGPLVEMLRNCGYVVLEAATPEAAIQICTTHAGPIALMITDVVMPGMSGSALLERVGPLRPEMKALFISGYTDDAVVRNGIRDAGVPFLQKPFTPSALGERARQLLDAA